MASKYITFNSGFFNDFVIFGTMTAHNEMAHQLRLLEQDIIGAGFCEIVDNKVIPYGRSESLRKSRSDLDENILNQQFKR